MKHSILFAAFMFSLQANAQIHNQPTEIIEAEPLSTFSERAGSWPTREIPEEAFATEESSYGERFNTIPGFVVRENGSPTYSIRGSGQADRVLRLYNGLPLNLADGVGASDLLIPAEVIGSLLILKGPSSVFYGSSAFAGAIDHRTRWFDRNALRFSVFDEGGKIGNRSVLGVMPIASGEKSKAQVSLFHERKPGQYPFESTSTNISSQRDNSASDVTRGTASGEYKISNTLLARTHLIAAKNVGETAGSLQMASDNTYSLDGTLAILELEKSFANNGLLAARFSDTRLWGLYDRDTGMESTTFSNRRALQTDARFMPSANSIARIFSDLSFSDLAASYYAGQSFTQTDFEVGTSWDYFFLPNWSLLPGVRYRSESGDFLKSLGLIYTQEASRAWLTYSEGFRSASLTDRFANTSYFVGNPGLKPERSNSIELGASIEQGKRYSNYFEGITAEVAVFHSEFNELHDTQLVGTADQKVNRGEASVYGAEGAIGYGVSVWTFTLQHAYLKARNKTLSEPLRLSPEHQFSFVVSHQIGPIVLEARETIWSPYFDRDAGVLKELPGWETLDLTFRTLGLTDWEIKGGVLNVLNEPRELTIGYPEPQRRFFASVMHFF